MTADHWRTERQAAIGAARQAGAILLDWAGRFTVSSKETNDLVTEADHAAQQAIRRSLSLKFPSDDFLEEEGNQAASRSSRRWIVDPLDGTTNYVHGFPFYCVSIALESDGELVVGVIYDPVRKECFAAAKGLGATCNDAAIQVSASARLEDSLVCAGLPANLSDYPSAPDAFAEVSRRARSVRRLGSAALSLAYVAAGRMDGYWASQLQPWDSAAGVVIVRESGGQATNLDLSAFDVKTPDLLASNGLIHPSLAAAIAS